MDKFHTLLYYEEYEHVRVLKERYSCFYTKNTKVTVFLQIMLTIDNRLYILDTSYLFQV